MTQIPSALKTILPYIQRANELQPKAPLVSFYCKTYAVQLGIELIKGNKDKETQLYLINLMDQLENDKKTLNPKKEEVKKYKIDKREKR
jgi:vacuolar protein sorting-associated protein VTA1